jgi:hypothetical protein
VRASGLLPRDVARGVAEFVERQCEVALSGPGDAQVDDVLSRLHFVQTYWTEARAGHPLAADGAARVLLELALLWRDRRGFDPRWLDWVDHP